MLRSFVETLTEAFDPRGLLFKAFTAALDQLAAQHLRPERGYLRAVPDLGKPFFIDVAEFLPGFAAGRYGAMRPDMKIYPGRHSELTVGGLQLSLAVHRTMPVADKSLMRTRANLVAVAARAGSATLPPALC